MKPDKSLLETFDRPEILMYLFYPRSEAGYAESGPDFELLSVPVEHEVSVGGRCYLAGNDAPNLLFFHGNGEIVADYDDLGTLYRRNGINFFPFDYRGYGKSGGRPSVSSMMSDCHKILKHVEEIIQDRSLTGPLAVMGRSLGSASAIELAISNRDRIDGLIVESGFARAIPLLRLLGIDVDGMGIAVEEAFDNANKIGKFNKPTLIIHGEYDQIIPFSDAEILYGESTASSKKLVKIEEADHNTIFMVGFNLYMSSLSEFLRNLR